MRKILPAFLSCQGPCLNDDEKRLFSKFNPLGICLFSKFCCNVVNKPQLKSLVTEIKETIGRADVLIAVDQEGGRVRRLLNPEFTAVTAQENLTTADLVREHAYLISSDLHSCGINVNFAPVLDIITEKTSQVLKGRCFADNQAEFGKLMVDEYIKCGICPCVKHLPGHGKAAVDPHLELPLITNSLKDLETDFAAFAQVKDAPMGMVAHIVLQAVDAENAATVSTKIINDIIRKHMKFSGLLVSDAIVMRALNGSIAEKSRRAIAAGCDVICLGNAPFEANEELCNSGIELTDEATQRLSKINKIIQKHVEFPQYEYIKNKYCTNLKNIISYDYGYDATEVLNRLHNK